MVAYVSGGSYDIPGYFREKRSGGGPISVSQFLQLWDDREISSLEIVGESTVNGETKQEQSLRQFILSRCQGVG